MLILQNYIVIKYTEDIPTKSLFAKIHMNATAKCEPHTLWFQSPTH